MGWQMIREPDGSIAIWSTVIDDFIARGLSVGGAVRFFEEGNRDIAQFNVRGMLTEVAEKYVSEMCAKWNVDLKEWAEGVVAGRPREGDWTWKEAVSIVRQCHGKRVK